MFASKKRTTQPAELEPKVVTRCLMDTVKPEHLRNLRERLDDDDAALLFEYKHDNHRQDRSAVLCHTALLRSLNEINPTGVWNFSVMHVGVVKYNESIGNLLSERHRHGRPAVLAWVHLYELGALRGRR